MAEQFTTSFNEFAFTRSLCAFCVGKTRHKERERVNKQTNKLIIETIHSKIQSFALFL